MEIHENIKRIRKEKNIPQKELAKRLNISPQNLAQYENGKRRPKIKTLNRIADALGVKPYELSPNIMDWGDFDTNSTHIQEDLTQIETIENYFQLLGFSIEYNVTKWHYENPDEPDLSERTQIVDEAEYILSKDGQSVVFTPEEFEEVQNRAKETIEGFFYKKLAQSEK